MAHTASTGKKNSLVKIGGSLGIAATCVALLAFLFGLFGFNAAFMLAPIPLLLSAIGMVLTVVGGVLRVHAGDEESQPIAALFACIFGLIGGAIEWYIWCSLTPSAG